MRLNITSLLLEGQRKLAEEHEKEEVPKIGTLRGGNCGLLDEDGKGNLMAVGYCPRLSYLRMLGFTQEIDQAEALMFALGHSNEDIWAAEIGAAYLPNGGKILRESEIPVVWQLTPTRLVTGRPDIVLATAAGIPEHGLELKQVCSAWTARDVMLGKPKTNHVIQAALYKWRLEQQFNKTLDWDLCYTSRVDFALPDWAGKLFPKKGTACSVLCEYSDKDGKIKKVRPFMTTYEWVGETAEGYVLRHELCGQTKTIQTIVSPYRIEQYYLFIDAMDTGEIKDLGPRPTNLEVDGTAGGFNQCDYCELAKTCDSFERNKAKWMAAVAGGAGGYKKLQ